MFTSKMPPPTKDAVIGFTPVVVVIVKVPPLEKKAVPLSVQVPVNVVVQLPTATLMSVPLVAWNVMF